MKTLRLQSAVNQFNKDYQEALSVGEVKAMESTMNMGRRIITLLAEAGVIEDNFNEEREVT